MDTQTRIVNTRLIIGDGSEPVDDAVVIIDSDRIVFAGRADQASAADSGAVLDAGGASVLPGFFDCHIHFGLEGWVINGPPDEYPAIRVFNTAERMRKTLSAGITSARDLGATEAGFKIAQQQGLVDGPRLQVAIRLLSHTGGHLDQTNKTGHDLAALIGEGHEICDTADEARVSARRVIRDGADLIKVCATGGVSSPTDQPEDEGLTEHEIAAVVDEARRHRGKRVAAHAQGTAGIKNAIRGGVTSIEHGYLVDDEGIDLMLARGTYLVPTLSTFGYIEREDPAVPAHVFAKKQRLAAQAEERIAAAIARGVPIALGTDAPIAPHGENLGELSRLVRLGMSPMAAISAGTLVAARLCGVESELGSLEAGKLADLVLVDGDPLRDIAVLADPGNIRTVIQGGRAVVDRSQPQPA